MGIWVSCWRFEDETTVLRQRLQQTDRLLKDMEDLNFRLRDKIAEAKKIHTAELKDLKLEWNRLNEYFRRAEGERKQEQQNCREDALKIKDGFKESEGARAQANSDFILGLCDQHCKKRVQDFKDMSDDIESMCDGFKHSHSLRQAVLDQRGADVDTSMYHPGTWMNLYHNGKCLEWWSCCQDVYNGKRDVPGCHHHKPRKIDIGALNDAQYM